MVHLLPEGALVEQRERRRRRRRDTDARGGRGCCGGDVGRLLPEPLRSGGCGGGSGRVDPSATVAAAGDNFSPESAVVDDDDLSDCSLGTTGMYDRC